ASEVLARTGRGSGRGVVRRGGGGGERGFDHAAGDRDAIAGAGEAAGVPGPGGRTAGAGRRRYAGDGGAGGESRARPSAGQDGDAVMGRRAQRARLATEYGAGRHDDDGPRPATPGRTGSASSTAPSCASSSASCRCAAARSTKS